MKTCNDCDHRELCRYRDEVENFINIVGRLDNTPAINGNPLRVDINCPSHKLSGPAARIK